MGEGDDLDPDDSDQDSVQWEINEKNAYDKEFHRLEEEEIIRLENDEKS